MRAAPAVRALAAALALDGQERRPAVRAAVPVERAGDRRVEERALRARRRRPARFRRRRRRGGRRGPHRGWRRPQSRWARRSPRLLPSAMPTSGTTPPSGSAARRRACGRRRCGGRGGRRGPPAAWWNSRACSSISPSISSSIALVARVGDAGHARPPRARRTRRAPAHPPAPRPRTASSPFTAGASSGGASPDSAAAEVEDGVRQPAQMLVLAGDHVLVGVVDVVLPGDAGDGLVAAAERRLLAVGVRAGGAAGSRWASRALLFLAGLAHPGPRNRLETGVRRSARRSRGRRRRCPFRGATSASSIACRILASVCFSFSWMWTSLFPLA